jgi:formylglycine-generating enzyme required for sulfatase activity
MENPNEPTKPHKNAQAEVNSGMAFGSLFCGLLSFCLTIWSPIAIFGLVLAIIGLVLGLKSRSSDRQGIAVAGIVFNSIYLMMAFLICSSSAPPPRPPLKPPQQESITLLCEGGVLNSKRFCEVKHPVDGSLMISIPEGEFTMGSDLYTNENPAQSIYLDGYYIDKFPVTNAHFREFVKETGYITDAEKQGYGWVRIDRRWQKEESGSWKTPNGLASIEGKENYPVTQVSFNDALAYCQWTQKDLPTEAQWEKAARGPDGFIYPWRNSEPDEATANFNNIIGTSTPVNEYEKGQSYYGLYDMAGNVYQWCKDWYAVGERVTKNPTGPQNGVEHVIKGASFIDGSENLRSANRDRYPSNYSSYLFGFRCSCEKITDQQVYSGSNKK